MYRIFGPPGTGKTTTLLNMVDKALSDGVPSSSIGFFAFTKKAASEAKERASRRFSLNPDTDLPFFRTIHSLAYRMLSVKEHQMMGTTQYKELSEAIGFELNGTSFTDEWDTTVKSGDHPILSLINLARTKKNDLRNEYNRSNINFTWTEVDYVANSYSNYKSANNLIDFTDLLENFAKEAEFLLPQFQLCFLDEAQDLSPLQWDIAHKLDFKSTKMYCAGDDDQAIYVWGGADVNHFIHLPGGSETLEQSHRVPRAVHCLAEKIASRIVNRFPKTYRPRNEEGSVQRIYDIEQLDLSEGTWLIMAHANYMLHPIATTLKEQGYLFLRGHDQRSIPEKMSVAINAWEQLRKGKAVHTGAVKAIYSFMSGNNIRIKRGFKKIETDDDVLLDLKTLQTHHGLLVGDEMIWHEAMDKIPDKDRAYIVAMLRRGEKFNAKPRIRLSTIHGTKGGEAENVVLMLDLTNAALEQSGDELHRTFYVGITRTLKNLYILEPDDYLKAYEL
tara:strand:- start:973 stop:2478 length:1506 start_codon:yes stop_codon:yes gene_type:complete